MFQLENNSWEKLCEQLQAQAFCNSRSLIDILFEINNLIGPKHNPGKILFTRLQSNILTEANALDEENKLKALSEVFCNHLVVKKENLKASDYLISTALDSKHLSSVLACILYRYFAEELGYKVVALGIENNSVLKCMDTDNSFYVDLESNGKILNSKELVAVFNNNKSCFREGFPETSKNKDLFKIYLTGLFRSVCPNGSPQIQIIVLNTLLKAFPGSIEHYGFRALLLAKLNRKDEAIKDLGKYFSFVPKEQASEELKACYCDLKSLH